MKKKNRKLYESGFLFLGFVLFTLGVKEIDVQAIGPDFSKVGFSSVNQFMFDLFGTNQVWYQLTDWLGIVAIIIALIYAVMGLGQLIKRKNIFLIDRSILSLGGIYGLTILFYIFFEKVIINYRPILMNGKLEASYPSSHTMIVLVILLTAILQNKTTAMNEKLKKIIAVALIVICLVTIIGRLLSGVHWLTDIVGGVLLSLFLVKLYSYLIEE